MNAKTVLFTLIVCAQLSCFHTKKNNEIFQESMANSVVLIFHNVPENKNFEREPGGPYSPAKKYKASYYDDHFIKQYITPQYGKEYDTITIPIKRDYIEIRHDYQTIDYVHYYLRKGDTLLLKYEGQKPIAKLSNRSSSPHDLNYDIHMREYLAGDDFLAITKQANVFFFFPKSKSNDDDIGSLIKEADHKFLNEANEELKSERKYLDSIFETSLISTEAHNHYKIVNKYNDHLITYNLNRLKIKSENSMAFRQYDTTWLGVHAFRRGLDSYVYNTFVTKVKSYKQTNGTLPDYKAVYDSINTSRMIAGKAKDYALFEYLQKIIENFSIADGQDYFSQFKQTVSDSILAGYISDKYQLGVTISDEISLINQSREQLGFTHVLEENKGKVIYVDFWASWCAPCIKALPFSKDLHKSNEDIVFIYLSMDDSFDNWEKSSKKYGLDEAHHSYLIDNKHTSTLLESLEVSSIPRYLLYDKKGELAHKNAPGPGSDAIRTLFDQYK